MTRMIQKHGLRGSIVAIVFICGLNLTAIMQDWDVPIIGPQKAYADPNCTMGLCTIVTPGGITTEWGCWRWPVPSQYPCFGCPHCG